MRLLDAESGAYNGIQSISLPLSIASGGCVNIAENVSSAATFFSSRQDRYPAPSRPFRSQRIERKTIFDGIYSSIVECNTQWPHWTSRSCRWCTCIKEEKQWSSFSRRRQCLDVFIVNWVDYIHLVTRGTSFHFSRQSGLCSVGDQSPSVKLSKWNHSGWNRSLARAQAKSHEYLIWLFIHSFDSPEWAKETWTSCLTASSSRGMLMFSASWSLNLFTLEMERHPWR